jgi:AsmA family
MTPDPQAIPQIRQKGRTKLWIALSALAVILALLIVPPFVSIRRYRSRITQAISASVGRPVRLSSVELRILPRPSFVLTDLIVEEDPAYGAEPVLHANTVTASIRLFPLWRGKLQISRISVDEASLNLVRTSAGRWNLDSFLRTAATRAQSGQDPARPMPLPYLEATNSRVNIKEGVEKLPFSLVNADLSFWQDTPGQWRVRLRGQPARTDVSLDLPDTGVVRLEATLRHAPDLRQMPVHLDMDWREAQLGQLSRLLLGSDQGWRGDLTGEVHVEGTAESAQVTTRLRASGVHRAEFAPASPIDFDASCQLVYHYSDRGMENVVCESPIGEGRARLTGDVPQHSTPPHLALELDRVPVQLALDLLRTVRSGLDPSLQAGGVLSGKIAYAPAGPSSSPPPLHTNGKPNPRAAKTHTAPPGPLSGSVTVTSLRLSGDSLSKPIQVAKVVIEPAPDSPTALAATVAVAAGAPAPLAVTVRLSLTGYQMGLGGPAALTRLRELAWLAGIPNASALEALDGPPAILDLTADGPWMPPPSPPPLDVPPSAASLSSANAPPPSLLVSGAADHVNGTITLHAVTWKAGFLANPVEIAAATLLLDQTGARWAPIAFSYGPVRGTATLELRAGCETPGACPPRFRVQFGALDGADLQAAILGAHQPGTMLSSLLARLRPSAPGWPELEGTVHADSLTLGPVNLTDATANLRIRTDGTEIAGFDATLLGGQLHAAGNILPGEKPDYKLNGHFGQVDAAGLGRLLGMNWSGGVLNGTGDLELVGFTDKDLAGSAKGSLHFEWPHGSISAAPDLDRPPSLARFDRWTADAVIADGAITLKQNQVQRGAKKLSVEASATFGDPPGVTFGASQVVRAAKQ